MNYLLKPFLEFYDCWKEVSEIKIPYEIFGPGIISIKSSDLVKTENFKRILLDSKNLIQ